MNLLRTESVFETIFGMMNVQENPLPALRHLHYVAHILLVLSCVIIYSGGELPKFRRNNLPPSSWNTVTLLWNRRHNFQQTEKAFVFYTTSRRAPSFRHTFFQCVTVLFPRDVRWLRCKSEQSPPTAKAKNAWSYPSTDPYALMGAVISSERGKL